MGQIKTVIVLLEELEQLEAELLVAAGWTRDPAQVERIKNSQHKLDMWWSNDGGKSFVCQNRAVAAVRKTFGD